MNKGQVICVNGHVGVFINATSYKKYKKDGVLYQKPTILKPNDKIEIVADSEYEYKNFRLTGRK